MVIELVGKSGIRKEYPMFKIHLKAARINAFMSEKELASKIGVSEKTYREIESGMRDVSYELAKKVEKAVGIPIEFLIFS